MNLTIDRASIIVDAGDEQKILTTDSRPATMTVFRCVPPGTVLDLHPAPRRQYLVTMPGSWEIEASNGVKRVFKAGDARLADDTIGEGHSSRTRQRTAYIHDRAAGRLTTFAS
ncbi:MAG: hypothetical protein ACREQ2_11485 [Candidatus Binatia bacterium]